ncbi:uncharacterized protein LOC131654433 [Vicia villosa]|uniref:uncharacterized protein LOC131654433 n=1 Tax=Vicia villosa TaxID=3911 RepID=UPI00273B8215|nr:uncharacterized protein LOC131654433 [Vicia villosa]
MVGNNEDFPSLDATMTNKNNITLVVPSPSNTASHPHDGLTASPSSEDARNNATPHSTTGETPFWFTYGTEAVIPIKVYVPTRRTEEPLNEEMNWEAVREELDLIEEVWLGTALRKASLKHNIALRYDTKVIKREFEVDSLVLKRNHKDSREGKLAANWEGPYRVRSKTKNRAYYLENLQGEELARPWNAQKLKQYYS